jgi:hypothetical protein
MADKSFHLFQTLKIGESDTTLDIGVRHAFLDILLNRLLRKGKLWGHPLAGRSRSTDVSREKNFLLSPTFILAQSVIFR